MTVGASHVSRSLVERLSGRTVVVIGDVMLDQFLIGRVNRISPEAPVPVVEFDHDEYRLGGAANVAHNIRALGGRLCMVGLVGRDLSGERLREQLREAGITPDAHGRRPVEADDLQAAHRDDAPAAGGARRLRGGPRSRWRRAGESDCGGDERDRRRRHRGGLRLFEGRRHARRDARGRRASAREGHRAAGRSEDSASALLRGRDADHSESCRSGNRDAPAHPHRTKTREMPRARSVISRSASR